MRLRVGPVAVVTIAYSLCLVDGREVEGASEDDPFEFRMGQHEVLPAIERAVRGREVGDHVDVLVPAAEGFGPHLPDRVQPFPRSAFDDDARLQPGQRYEAETEEGLPVSFTVVRTDESSVLVDFNHPLAGRDLRLKATVLHVA